MGLSIGVFIKIMFLYSTILNVCVLSTSTRHNTSSSLHIICIKNDSLYFTHMSIFSVGIFIFTWRTARTGSNDNNIKYFRNYDIILRKRTVDKTMRKYVLADDSIALEPDEKPCWFIASSIGLKSEKRVEKECKVKFWKVNETWDKYCVKHYKYISVQHSFRLIPLDLVLKRKISVASDHPSRFLLWIMTSYSVDGRRP